MKRKLFSSCKCPPLAKRSAVSLLDGNKQRPRFVPYQHREPHHTADSVRLPCHWNEIPVARTRIGPNLLNIGCWRPAGTPNCHIRFYGSWTSPHVTMSHRPFSSSHRPGQSSGALSFNTNGTSPSKRTRYVIALGSNMGDRFHWIEQACREMEAAGIRIYGTSGLWQTKAMYVENQDDFLNGTCLVETTLQPLELMKTLQGVENKLGRVKVVDKGPRNIDLDIVLWEGGEFQSAEPDLTIPHRLMEERDFVLAPLSQLLPPPSETELPGESMPEAFIRNPEQDQYRSILDRLWKASREQAASHDPQPISSCTQLSKSLPLLIPSQSSKKTHIMSILNLTPDSFSDGGRHTWNDEEYLHSTILTHLQSGATIIDLGGQSSRPGAPDITASEEITRITPALEILSSLRQDPRTPPFAVSIDTYRAAVAQAAVEAGADIVNDISAGTLDPDMLPTVAKLGCTYLLMHMRGTPHTMTSKENTTYSGDLIATIRSELLDRVAAAEDAGIRRWRMLLDPGIGFAKTAAQNLEILRRAAEVTGNSGPGGRRIVNGAYRSLDDIPWLFGSSRKGFVGKATGVKEASQRTWGTAATVAAAVHGGADIVRVHDVAEMAQVVRMSEAIWRGGPR